MLADYYLSGKVASPVIHLKSPITLQSSSALVKESGEVRLCSYEEMTLLLNNSFVLPVELSIFNY